MVARGYTLLLFAFIAISSSFAAELIYAPIPTKASGSNDVVAVLLQNPTTGALKSQYITFGHPFFKTQLVMPSNTSIMTAYWTDNPTNTVDVQVDAKALHDDGSVRQATITLLQPSIPANTTLSLMLTRTLRASSALSINGLPTSVVTVNIKVLNSTVDKTFDVKQLITTAGTTQDYWLQGELAVQTRVSTWMLRSMRMVFDATLYKDNSWCVDVIFTNDIAMTNDAGRIQYDTTITPVGGAAISYNNLTHFQYTGFHKLVCSAGVSDVNVQYDQLNMIQAAAILPLNYTIGFFDNFISEVKTAMRSASWGVPFATNGVTQAMPNTGDRRDIGGTPAPMAAWFVSQNADAKKYMMGWGDTSHAIPWNYYNNNTGRYLNWWDYPNLWLDGRGDPKPPQLPSSAETGWMPEGSHNPSLAVLPYIVSGSRYYLDLLTSEAAWKVMEVWPAYRANGKTLNYKPIDKGIICYGVQIRSAAWALRDVGWASWLNTPDSWHKRYFDSVVKDNLEFIMTNQTGKWSAMYGEIQGFFDLPYGSGYGTHPPWQDDFMTSSLAMLALHGESRAADVMMWMRNFQVLAALETRWNRNNRVAYNIFTSPSATNASDTCKTWQCMQSVMDLKGANVTTLSSLGGYYGQLARQTFILYQTVFPQDTAAAAARKWIEEGKAQYVDDATSRREPKFNVGNFPLAVPLPYTFNPSTIAPVTTGTNGNSDEDNAATAIVVPLLSVAITMATLFLM